MKKINGDVVLRNKIDELEATGPAPIDMAAAWQKLELRLDNNRASVMPPVRKKLPFSVVRMAAAAVLLLLAGFTAFFGLRRGTVNEQLAGMRTVTPVSPEGYTGTATKHTVAEPSKAILPVAHKTASIQSVKNTHEIPVAMSPVSTQPALSPAQEIPQISAPVTVTNEKSSKPKPVLRREMEVAFVDDILNMSPQPAPIPEKSSFVKLGGYHDTKPAADNDESNADPRLLARGKEMHRSSNAFTIKF